MCERQGCPGCGTGETGGFESGCKSDAPGGDVDHGEAVPVVLPVIIRGCRIPGAAGVDGLQGIAVKGDRAGSGGEPATRSVPVSGAVDLRVA